MARPVVERTILEPGRRDRIVTLQQRTESIGTSGAPVETWTTLVAQMPAAKRLAVGRERFQVNQEVASSDTVWEINYRVDMDPDLVDVANDRRVLYQGRVYDIVACEELGRRHGLALMTVANPARTS